MGFRFTKMHGLGNDFMVIDAINQSVNLSAETIRQLSHRHRGIGFDQCLLVEKSTTPTADFSYRIFNADGQEVGQCGNGARCLALFIRKTGLSDKKILRVTTKTTQMELIIQEDNQVTVNMGVPNFDPEYIPLLYPKRQEQYLFSTNESELQGHALSIGNPHLIIPVQDVSLFPVETLGPLLEQHALFPEQVNVGFMHCLDTTHMDLRVYERGAGETMACGSGAVAAAIIGRLYYGMQEAITVQLLGGQLEVQWKKEGEPAYLTGPASFVYDGMTTIKTF